MIVQPFASVTNTSYVPAVSPVGFCNVSCPAGIAPLPVVHRYVYPVPTVPPAGVASTPPSSTVPTLMSPQETPNVL